ncbi:MAG TPA: type II toxin-antitoxin system HicB family antitoxin [Bacteroidetes bacterium]|nr:type II toxin-antitoxin system HicB family antitoxin [Bacteroidota bacterium]
MRETTALIEMGKDGSFGVFAPDLDNTVIGDGKSVEEAKNDFENSVNEIIASYTENGKKIPDELRDIKFVYKYDLSSLFNYYPILNISQLAKAAKINVSLMHQYKAGQYISEKQIGKIEKVLREIGTELSRIELI